MRTRQRHGPSFRQLEKRFARADVPSRGRHLLEGARHQDLHLRGKDVHLPAGVRKRGMKLRDELRERDLHLPERLAELPRPHLEFRRPQEKKKRRGSVTGAWPYLLAAGGGAFLMFLLDPAQGRRRRALTRDKAGHLSRRGFRAARGSLRGATAGLGALSAKATHPRFRQHAPEDDITLEHKVESVLFRDRGVPKGDININVERGTVVLRGQVERHDQVVDIERRVRKIAGVQDVENLLHLPGEPAPNKAEALEAQHQAEQIIASGRKGGQAGH
jgi:hypothetical protein